MNTKLNKSDFYLLGIYFSVSSSLIAKGYYDRKALIREYIFDIPTEIITLVVIILVFFYWLIPNFIVKSNRYFLFLFLGVLTIVFFGGIDYLIGFWSGNNDWNKFPKSALTFAIKMIDRTTYAVALPFALLLSKKFYEGQTEYLKIEKQQKENELKLLRSQLDPHFLFNNLNTLDALIDSNPTKAKEYINCLSLIYRYLIQTKDSEVMELSEELTLAENYIFLIKTRFGNDYDFTIEKTTSIDNKFIPTGAIQALLENIVKHNKASNENAIKSTIFIDEKQIKITNQKSQLCSTNTSFGTGLENLKMRYKLLTDKQVIITNTNVEFSVSIPIINLDS